jgi:hypothetical protein
MKKRDAQCQRHNRAQHRRSASPGNGEIWSWSFPQNIVMDNELSTKVKPFDGHNDARRPQGRVFIPLQRSPQGRNSSNHDDTRSRKRAFTELKTEFAADREIRPTRRNVLNMQTVELNTYVGGAQYFPMLPISDPARLNGQTDQLTRILATFPNVREVYTITIDDMLNILEFHFADQNGPGAWKDELIRNAVRLMRDGARYHNQARLVIPSRDSNIGKNQTRGSMQVGAVLPGGTTSLLDYGVDRNLPALAMVLVRGDVAQNWEGTPFWLPLIRFPNGNYAFSVNRG